MQFVLQTKINKPQPSENGIERLNLIRRLDEGLKKKLILAVAPAGYGKTTLLSQWISKHPNSVWYSVDNGDNNITQFLNYLLTTIKNYREELADPSIQILQNNKQKPPFEYILGELINQLSLSKEEIVITIDDYHLIHSNDIHKMMEFFIKQTPPNVHFVIGTRSDPPIMLARLRSQNQVLELRANDLCFSEKETADFFTGTMNLTIEEEEIKKLDKRIEGWIAGLQMVGITIQGKKNIKSYIENLSSSNQYLLDYLSEEIYQQQNKEVQKFLLQTSILNRFNVSLCNFLNEIENSEYIIEHLRKTNLFIVPLDEERNWFRYHHLFADLLLHRLQKNLPEKLMSLYTRAGLWFEQYGSIIEGVDYYIKAKDFEKAENVITRIAEKLWIKGEQGLILGWIKLFPKGHFFNARLSAVIASLLVIDGRYSEAERLADAATAKQKDNLNNDVRGMIAAVKAYSANYQGKMEDIHKYGTEALSLLNDEFALWRCLTGMAMGDLYVQQCLPLTNATNVYQEAFRSGYLTGDNYCITLAQHRLVVMYHRRGKLDEAFKLIRQFLDIDNETKSQSGALFLIYGELLYENNNLLEAKTMFRKSIELCRKQHHVAALPYCCMMLAKLYLAEGNKQQALEETLESIRILKQFDMPPWVNSFVLSWDAYLNIMCGKTENAETYFKKENLEIKNQLNYPNTLDYIVYARYLIVTKKYNDAIVLLKRMEKHLSEIEWMEILLKCWIYIGFAYFKTVNNEKATSYLIRTLDFAKTNQYKRTILDAWDLMEELLVLIQPILKYDEYIGELKQIAANKTVVKESIIQHEELIEPLSERELEVLKLLPTQMTNHEIADKLFISVNTVKTHIKNIYFKLDTNNRKKAVEKAYKVGLL